MPIPQYRPRACKSVSQRSAISLVSTIGVLRWFEHQPVQGMVQNMKSGVTVRRDEFVIAARAPRFFAVMRGNVVAAIKSPG